MKINPYLKDTKVPTPKQTNIYFSIRLNGEVFKFYVDRKIMVKDWNQERGEARKSLSGQVEFNKELLADQNLIFKTYQKFKLVEEREPTVKELQNELRIAFGKTSQVKTAELIEYFKQLIEDTTKGIRKSNGKVYSQGTISTYNSTFKHLVAFNNKIQFKDIDLKFYKDFTEYLTKKEFKPNTIGKFFKVIKTVLNEAFEDGINTNQDFKKKGFKVIKEEVENIALTKEELDILKNYKLETEKEILIRDLFVIGCLTGQRISDWGSLFKGNPRDRIIEITQTKTGSKVAIPFTEEAIEIINKYPNLSKLPPDQVINETIKDICEKIDVFKQEITFNETIAGQSKEVTIPKYRLISSHTARRTFATIQHLKGTSTQHIMAITGHKTEKSFLTYIKSTSREMAEQFLKLQ